MSAPVLWFVAGADGVGKTSFAFRHIAAVSGSKSFVNLDEIARGLSPLDPEREKVRAGRIALQMLRDAMSDRSGPARSITVETTLSGKTHLRTMHLARSSGWKVHLLYFAVRSPEVSLARVARRVSEGGHNVPEIDVRRRYSRSLENLPEYIAACDFWRVYDNNSFQPATAAEGRQNCLAWSNGDWSGLPIEMQTMLGNLPLCPEV